MDTRSDETLAEQAQRGDEAAFVALLRRHGGGLLALLRRSLTDPDDVSDAWAETLYQAWRDLPGLRRPAAVRAWLVAIARQRSRDLLRRRGRTPTPEDPDVVTAWLDSAAGASHGPSAVSEALGELPPAEQDAARRFYLDGQSIAEIAAATNAPAGTVKRRLFMARQRLRGWAMAATSKEQTDET